MITKEGYVLKKQKLTKKDETDMIKDLTIIPKKMEAYNYSKKDNSFSLLVETDETYIIPRFYGITHFGKPKIDNLKNKITNQEDIKYTGLLRPHQEVIVKKIIAGFEKKSGGLLIAGCGIGKTNMAIYIACHYKVKTLFVAHKKFLLNQINDRIKTTTNVQHVGLIRQKKFDVSSPFVVGMVNSLCRREYDMNEMDKFDLIVIDEVHHMGAKFFSSFYKKYTAKYMLGISAENKRNDGTFKLIKWYMGPILHNEPQKPNDMVIVKKIYFKTSSIKNVEMLYMKFNNEPNRAAMVTNLAKIKLRNRMIYNIINILADKGRNILVLTSRLFQLNVFYKLLEENPYSKGLVGKYIGGMSEKELNISATKQIILGTFEMAREGLDIPELDAIILATPIGDPKQAIYRIIRKEKEHMKINPLVFDIIDFQNPNFLARSNRRQTFYEKQDFLYHSFNVADYEENSEYILWNDLEKLNELIDTVPEKKQKIKKEKIDYSKLFGIDEDKYS